MFEVTVEAGFSSGHYLRNYRGKCENPHGHNYKVFVTLIGKELDEAGLLLDFKLLKQVMRPIVEYLDHQMINELKPFDEINPSAENLARWFAEKLEVSGTLGWSHVAEVTVWEGPENRATYRPH